MASLSLYNFEIVDQSLLEPFFELLMTHILPICQVLNDCEDLEHNTEREQMKKDLVTLCCKSFAFMESQNIASLAKNHLVDQNRFLLPEMLTKLIVSGCLQREEIEHAVKALGQLMVESDELISHILQPKAPEQAPDRFGLLSAFQMILSESTSLTRQAILWLVSNLVLNSSADMRVFL